MAVPSLVDAVYCEFRILRSSLQEAARRAWTSGHRRRSCTKRRGTWQKQSMISDSKSFEQAQIDDKNSTPNIIQ
uniref:Uncharacterized protein n=1 Tax=Romanomermis culicivorax TaxID=13658 RepID=A0A915JA58_ROMCU